MIKRFKSEFKERELENSFRRSSLNKESFQGIFAFSLCILPLVLFAFSDYLLFGLSDRFLHLSILRGLILIIIAGMILLLKFNKRYILNDAAIFLFSIFIISGIFYIYSTRPQSYSPYAVYDIISILSIYLLFPNRFILQLIPALIYTLLNIFFLLKSGVNADIVISLRIIISLLFANVLGIFLSWRFHYLNRMEYYALKKEKEVSAALDTALKNVKTLSGLLPICSKCHKIRNDEGYWKSIDKYIEEHSDAQFTHSLCSDCMDLLYGNDEWYKKSKNKK